MKKVLLASSALVGVAALTATPAAAQFDVSLSGFIQFHASAGGADEHTADRGGGFAMNTEYHVNGKGMADNGLEYGFRIEVEADSGSSNTQNVDEAVMYLQGSWGRIELGSEDGAEDRSMVAGTNNGVSYGGVGNPTGTFMTDVDGGAAPTSVDIDDNGDAVKVTYYTPRFSGFRLGVSYSPESNAGNGRSATDFSPDLHGDFHDFVGAGLNYSGEFNGVGIDAGIVGAFADIDPADGTGDGSDSLTAFGGGLQISYMGFNIAGGYENTDRDDDGEHSAFDVGAGYETGPWFFGVNAIWSEGNSGPGTGDDEWEAYSATVTYGLAPGVTLNLAGIMGTADPGDGSEENDFAAVTTSVLFGF